MYNTDYLPQMEKFRGDLFGFSNGNIRNYFLPDVKTIPCKENENGEFVPSGLEETVEE